MIPQELKHERMNRFRRLTACAVGFKPILGDFFYEVFGENTAG
jgi:hypothetical protein